MRLKHTDEAVFKVEGVVERAAIDAREMITSGLYEQVPDAAGVEAQTAEKVEKDAFDSMKVKQLKAHLTEAKVSFETDANKAALVKLARDAAGVQ